LNIRKSQYDYATIHAILLLARLSLLLPQRFTSFVHPDFPRLPLRLVLFPSEGVIFDLS
jgi:hypothetical protein